LEITIQEMFCGFIGLPLGRRLPMDVVLFDLKLLEWQFHRSAQVKDRHSAAEWSGTYPAGSFFSQSRQPQKY